VDRGSQYIFKLTKAWFLVVFFVVIKELFKQLVSQFSLFKGFSFAFIYFIIQHKSTEKLGLEGTSGIIKLQPPCHRQGHQPPCVILDQAAQGPIQPSLEHPQGHPQPLLPPGHFSVHLKPPRGFGENSSYLLPHKEVLRTCTERSLPQCLKTLVFHSQNPEKNDLLNCFSLR